MNFLSIDDGTLVDAHAGLVRGENKVRLYTNWPSTAPMFQEFATGTGFEGVEKVLYFEDHFDWADCVVNFDVHMNDRIAFLRKHFPEKSIFGAGRGARLEDDRWGFKKVLKSVGLKVGKATKVKGITGLSNFLKENKNQYVKINIFRGCMESFFAKDFESAQLLIDEMATSLGPLKEEYDFICEDKIDAPIEIGMDSAFNGKDYIRPFFSGIEIKKNAYFCKVTDTLPSQIKESMDSLKPIFQELDWRGFISTEERVVSKTEHYVIDLCARMPSPLGLLYPQFIMNYSEAIYKIGKKEDVRFDVVHKYLGAFALSSTHAIDNWLKLEVAEKDRSNVKFFMSVKHNNNFYAVPGEEKVIVLVAGGSSVDQVISTLKKYASRVSAYGLHTDEIEGINQIHEEIAKAKKVGIEI